MSDPATLGAIMGAISGSKFFTVLYHAKGKVIGGVRMNDAIKSFQLQTMRPATVRRSSVAGLKLLQENGCEDLLSGLSDRVLIASYQPPKGKAKAYPPSVVEVLTTADLMASVSREIASLSNLAERAKSYTQADVWECLGAGVFKKVADPKGRGDLGALQVRGYVVNGNESVVTAPLYGWHTPNSKRESRANAVVRGWIKGSGIKSLSVDRIVRLTAGGSCWVSDGYGGLRIA
jgi:hypothetical protein